MSVKIFCNSCQKFIKDADKNQIKSLDGNEICENCLAFNQDKIKDIQQVARKGIVQIERARDAALAELDRSIRKVIHSDEE